MKRVLRKLPRALLALAIGLVLLELGLQAAALALALGRSDRAGDAGIDPDTELVVLCVGDSHTYGWLVREDHTWPARLEAWLAGAGVKARFVNRGLPGKNTGNLLEELPGYLERYRPDAVMILAGANNPWSRLGERREAPPWYTGLRTWKLLAIAGQHARGHVAKRVRRRLAEEEAVGVGDTLDVEERGDGFSEVRMRTREGDAEVFVIGGGTITKGNAREGLVVLVHDLAELCRLSREAGAEPFLLTYGSDSGDPLEYVADAVRAAAERAEAPLLDQAAFLRPLIAELGYDRLLLPDAHPRPEGYEVLSAFLFNRLIEEGLVDGEPIADPAAPLRARAAPVAELRLVSAEGGSAVLEARYEPGLEVSVFFARATEPTTEFRDREIPLADDELFQRSIGDGRLDASFGDDEKIEIPVPEAVLAGEGAVYAAMIVRTPGWTPLAVAGPVRVR